MLNTKRYLAAVLGLVSAYAWSQGNNTTITWREETVANGRTILVERTETYKRVFDGNSNGWFFQRERVSAIPPAIAWEGKNGIRPLALDYANGEFFLVAAAATLEGVSEYALSDGVNHVAFVFRGGTWARIPPQSVPISVKPNLLVNPADVFFRQGYPPERIVDLALKQKMASQPGLDSRYKDWPRN